MRNWDKHDESGDGCSAEDDLRVRAPPHLRRSSDSVLMLQSSAGDLGAIFQASHVDQDDTARMHPGARNLTGVCRTRYMSTKGIAAAVPIRGHRWDWTAEQSPEATP